MPPQERVGDRDGSTATRSSSMTLKLVNGGVPATSREAAAELARGVHIFVTLISPSACMWSCLLCTATHVCFLLLVGSFFAIRRLQTDFQKKKSLEQMITASSDLF